MNKEEFYQDLKLLALPAEIENVLVDLVEKQETIDDDFLDKLANLLDLLASYFANLAKGAGKVKEKLDLLDEALELVDLEQKNLVMDFLLKQK